MRSRQREVVLAVESLDRRELLSGITPQVVAPTVVATVVSPIAPAPAPRPDLVSQPAAYPVNIPSTDPVVIATPQPDLAVPPSRTGYPAPDTQAALRNYQTVCEVTTGLINGAISGILGSATGGSMTGCLTVDQPAR